MSSTDKTREALMNTMVTTKTGAKTNESPANKASAPASTKPVAKKKAATRKKAVAKKATPKKPAAKSAPQADPFQSKGRVWPD